MDGSQNTVPDSASTAGLQFHYLASSLAKLLETASRELERDREAAKGAEAASASAGAEADTTAAAAEAAPNAD